MFKNYSNCARCTHASVCQYKPILKEVYDKIGGKWDNLVAPDIFKLGLKCTEYQANKTIEYAKGELI